MVTGLVTMNDNACLYELNAGLKGRSLGRCCVGPCCGFDVSFPVMLILHVFCEVCVCEQVV